MPNDEKPVSDTMTLTVVGKRCVYLNNFRVAGGKPYVSENLPEHSFEVTRADVLRALAMPELG